MLNVQFLRFGLVGAFVSGVHLVLVFLLTDFFGVWYLYSTIISYTLATVINFTLQKVYVMRNRDVSQSHIQFVKYVLLVLFCLLINTLGMYAFVGFLGVSYLYAQVYMTVGLAIFTFFISRSYVFHQ